MGIICERAIAVNDPIATWTFETNPPGGAGCGTTGFPACPTGTDYPSGAFPTQSADLGTGIALGHHATAATAWSNPTGNGSAESFSSNQWLIGDYYQFQVSTAGLSNIGLQFEQTGSNTGPRDFKVQYSTNGTSFTDLGTYATNGLTWSSVAAITPPEQDTYAFSLNSIPAVNNQASLYIRLTDAATVANNGGAIGTAGTSRVDNVNIFSNFDITQPPIIGPTTPPVLPQANDVVLGLPTP